MGHNQYEGCHVTQAQAQSVAGHPPALVGADWDIVIDNFLSLDAFHAAVQLIQGDEAVVCAYLLIAIALQRRLASLVSSISHKECFANGGRVADIEGHIFRIVRCMAMRSQFAKR